jgi:hypothetical protein
MENSALYQEVDELARSVDQARAAAQRAEWQLGVRALTEAQDRIGRLLKEIGDKSAISCWHQSQMKATVAAELD